MKRYLIKKIIFIISLGFLCVGTCQAWVGVSVGMPIYAGPPCYPCYGPPPCYVSPYPPCPPPCPEVVWVPGHWNTGCWIPGHYAEVGCPPPPPAPCGFVWIGGGYDGCHRWHHGRWRRHCH